MKKDICQHHENHLCRLSRTIPETYLSNGSFKKKSDKHWFKFVIIYTIIGDWTGSALRLFAGSKKAGARLAIRYCKTVRLHNVH
jgi:hypothetical protein